MRCYVLVYLMMVIVTSYHVFFLCFAVLEARHFTNLGINIRVRAFDYGGREASLLTDGGSVEITCRYVRKGTETLKLYLTNETEQGKLVKPVTGNNTLVQHRVAINAAALKKTYMCKAGSEVSPKVQLSYVLCNPLLVKPVTVCGNTGEFCQVTQTGSPKCRTLSGKSCFYGHHPKEFTQHSRNECATNFHVHVLPKFCFVCREDRTANGYGLCDSLWLRQAPGLLATKKDGCDIGFRLYVARRDTAEEKQLMLGQWDFVDLAVPFQVKVYVQKWTENLELTWIIRNTTNKSLDVEEQLKQLPTPTIADIICIANDSEGPVFQFQTRLLLFRSNQDLKHWVTIQKIGETGGYVIFWVIINVTATDGLYACINRGNTKCVPSHAGHVQSLKLPAVFKQGEQDNFTIMYYIGLFASSPRRTYVLLHEEIRNWTPRLSSIDYTMATTAASHEMPNTTNKTNGSTMQHSTKDNIWKIVFVATLVIAIVIIAAMAVSIILLVRHKGTAYSLDHQR